MRIYDNGIYRDMTPEEIEAMEGAQEQAPPHVPTPEERLDALEAAIMRGVELGYER